MGVPRTTPNFESSIPFCKCSNLIYKIKCKICDIIYIGETSTPLNIRINNHRSLIKKKKGLEAEHFGVHGFGNAEIEILEFEADTKSRKQKESVYMLKYKSIYPYGLNERIGNVVALDNLNNMCVYRQFYKPINSINIKKHRSLHKNKKEFINIDNYVTNLDILDNNAFNNKFRYFFRFIFSRKVSFLKLLLKHVIKVKFNIIRYKHIVIDLIKFKIGIEINPQIKEVALKHIYLTLPFTKFFPVLDLKDINNKTSSLLPIEVPKPLVSFKLTNTIGNLVYNYRKIADNLDLDNLDKVNCKCKDPIYSEFCDPYYGHILTGNIDIVNNSDLRWALSKGAKFRPIFFKGKENFLIKIKEFLDLFILKYAYVFGIPIIAFLQWKHGFLEQAKVALEKGYCRKFFSKFKIKAAIEELQKDLVITPVDKAGSNFTFCCKLLYSKIIKKELYSGGTYNVCSNSEKDIIAIGINCNKNVDLKFDSSCYKLPYFFATGKFHKNPVKFRFITSSVNTIFKKYSLLVNAFLDQLSSYIYSRTNIKLHNNFIIENNLAVIKNIKNNNIKSVITFDFTTLYTKIPIDLLYDNICNLYEEFWPETDCFVFENNEYEKSTILAILKCSLKHNYIKIGNKIFNQVIGIPMGSNYSVNLANLFLFYYEYKFLKNCKHAEAYNLTSRYIDDLIAFNNDYIINDIRCIYPACMTVEISNEAPFREAHYLDLCIKINNLQGCNVSLYDKRRDYKFKILGFPNINSDIPSNLGKNTFMGQIIRIKRIDYNNFNDFVINVNILIKKFIENGYKLNELIKYVKLVYYKYPFTRYYIKRFLNGSLYIV
jgi:hypothetical protein